MPDPLLQTKLHIPVTRSSLLPRSRLLDRLNAGLGGRLTLVSAPAGFGKTTLIVQWSRQLDETKAWRPVWLSLDENDNDLGRFFEYFIAALQQVDHRLGQSALELLRSPQASNTQVVLTDLLNTLAQTPRAILLILDDYHLVDNIAIHDAVQFLVENAPSNFHLLLITRLDPPFSLARLRARSLMTEIRQADLRFGLAETAAFFGRLMNLDLGEMDIAALQERTEGWPVGLQMAALSLQGQPDSGKFLRGFTASNRFVLDYLLEEVLARRPEGTRVFLLHTARLDRFCAPLCDAVLGEKEALDSPSQGILEQLEAANLFLVPLDNERRWYRYHHLFANLLQQIGRREQPGLGQTVHQRASRWFEEAGFPEEAVLHAIQAADHDRAANLLMEFGDDWFRQGDLGKIMLWVERMPEDWHQEHPQLAVQYAWALLFSGRGGEAVTMLPLLPSSFAESSIDLLVIKGLLAVNQGESQQAIAFLNEADERLAAKEPTLSNQNLRGMAANSLAYIQTMGGEFSQAEINYREGIALAKEAGNLYAALLATLGWGFMLTGRGRLKEAEVVFLDGLQTEQDLAQRYGIPDRALISAAPLRINLGQLYYLWNRLAGAEEQLVVVSELLDVLNPADSIVGLVALAKLYLAQGRTEAALEVLEQLESMERKARLPAERAKVTALLIYVRCDLYRRQPTSELRSALSQSLSQLQVHDSDPLTQARAMVALGRHLEVIPLLEPLAAKDGSGIRFGQWLESLVLLGLAYQNEGKKEDGLAMLARAVEAGAKNRYIRPFLDEGEQLYQMLKVLAQRKSAPDYTALLLEAFEAARGPSSVTHESSPLSPRESEVLILIAKGLTNQQIADRLVIAPSTAKRHVVNIYNKLDVNNRAEATAKAYELGLVNPA